MKAVAFVERNSVELQDLALRGLEPGEVLIETLFSMISPGTELRCLAGLQPDAEPWGFIPGYTLTGIVREGDPQWIGKTVIAGGTTVSDQPRMWGGHVSHAIAASASLVEIPSTIEPRYAGLARLFAIALRGLRVAFPGVLNPNLSHERVQVIGLGPIGLASALWFHRFGALVYGEDLETPRRQIARGLGIVDEPIPNEFVNVVVEATGSTNVLSRAHERLATPSWTEPYESGRNQIIIQASYPEGFEIPYQSAFLKEATYRMPRHHTPSDLSDALAAMADHLPYKPLLTDVVPAAQAADAYRRLQAREPGAMTFALDWTA